MNLCRRTRTFLAALTTALSLIGPSYSASAGLTFTPLEKSRAIAVAGDFSLTDDLAPFVQLAREHSAQFVTFDSRGGNPYKAMELGRIIRRLGLSTVQLKQFHCESACSLAFLGGVARMAEAGSIGIHQSSLGPNAKLGAKDAVSAVQSLTAAIISYTIEMGADPALIETALKYDADDMRFLSKSEMRRFRVTTDTDPGRTPRVASSNDPNGTAPIAPPPTAQPSTSTLDQRDEASIPKAISGRIRHPKGASPVKFAANVASSDVITLKNGTRVTIVSTEPNWYKVEAEDDVGYLHHTWVSIDQFPQMGKFDDRFIQVKSLASYPSAVEYVRLSPLNLAIFRATNGWYAITLAESSDYDRAVELLGSMKSQGKIPTDAFLSFGNTYARKVCCAKK